MERPLVYIILLNWNGYDLTRECISSLFKISYTNYKIIVVDNCSEDDSYSKLKSEFDGDVVFIANESNLGFTGGNNVGITRAIENNADYVLLLNNDTVVDELFLDELINKAVSDDKIGILGPKIYYYAEPENIWFSGGRFNKLKGGMSVDGMGVRDNGQFDKVADVDYITGCALLVKKEVLEKVGLLDKDYFIYAEEVDFCFRAKRNGYRVVYIPSSKVWHKVAQSFKGNFTPFYLYFQSKNRLLLIKKNFSKLYLIYCFIVHILFYIPYKLTYIWFKEKNKRFKASLSLFVGTYDFLFSKNKPRFFR
ncbi:glycosyltransferase family 2 protein [bacterium]|nr:glycosyltransferase family 2 protein [bacterium]